MLRLCNWQLQRYLSNLTSKKKWKQIELCRGQMSYMPSDLKDLLTAKFIFMDHRESQGQWFEASFDLHINPACTSHEVHISC